MSNSFETFPTDHMQRVIIIFCFIYNMGENLSPVSIVFQNVYIELHDSGKFGKLHDL